MQTKQRDTNIETTPRPTGEDMAILKPVTFVAEVYCDDCGQKADWVYDAPWRDNKVRCEECFLISEGYTREMLSDFSERVQKVIQQYLAEINHEREAIKYVARIENE